MLTVFCPPGFPNIVSGGYEGVDIPPPPAGPGPNHVEASFPVGLGPVPVGAWRVVLDIAETWTVYAICSR